MSNSSTDVVIIGGGIVGLTLARALKKKGVGKIIVLEKEDHLGEHSSGRNSGVIHAGLYYPAGSLKARLCVEGSRQMRAYAQERGIPFQPIGKVIVSPTPEQLPMIETIHDRAVQCGVRIERIDDQQLRELEPEAKTCGNQALYSPETAIIDSKKVLASVQQELQNQSVEISLGEKALRIDEDTKELHTNQRTLAYGHLINAAGLHADRVAHQIGVGQNYRILPFKGVYRKLHPEAARRFRKLIYPVPDLRVPFLGVHLTKNMDGSVSVGPTAIPALGRENYGIFEGLNLSETPEMAISLLRLWSANQNGFRNLVREEIPKYHLARFHQSITPLAPNIRQEDIGGVYKVGLRAQLYRVDEGKLEMDFVVERGKNSTHILNAVSPAFTASFAFADWVIDTYYSP